MMADTSGWSAKAWTAMITGGFGRSSPTRSHWYGFRPAFRANVPSRSTIHAFGTITTPHRFMTQLPWVPTAPRTQVVFNRSLILSLSLDPPIGFEVS